MACVKFWSLMSTTVAPRVNALVVRNAVVAACPLICVAVGCSALCDEADASARQFTA